MTIFPTILLAASFFSPGIAFADTVHLKNGETLAGEVDTLKEGVLNLKLADGGTRSVKRAEIASILFGPPEKPVEKGNQNFLTTFPKADSPFQTPRATFERWRAAAIRGDIKGMVECYASFKQSDVKKELKKLPKDAFEKMREATAETQFVASDPFYQGDRAIMEVNWTKGLSGDSQSLSFVLEKNDWKIVQ